MRSADLGSFGIIWAVFLPRLFPYCSRGSHTPTSHDLEEVCALSMPWALCFVPDAVIASGGRHSVGSTVECRDAVATMGDGPRLHILLLEKAVMGTFRIARDPWPHCESARNYENAQ